MTIVPQNTKTAIPLYQNCGLCLAETERFSSSTLRYANFGLANRATPKACTLGASAFASSAQISLMRFFTNVKKLNHSIVLPLPQKKQTCFLKTPFCARVQMYFITNRKNTAQGSVLSICDKRVKRCLNGGNCEQKVSNN